MSKALHAEQIRGCAVEDLEVEIVERKGKGHPDSLIDGAAESVSRYLTVTGTSAEQGDDGNTERGNRINGLISPIRQYSMEATAGKNSVNHT